MSKTNDYQFKLKVGLTTWQRFSDPDMQPVGNVFYDIYICLISMPGQNMVIFN